MSRYRIIISGGGTGGHIFPAIAIANALISMLEDVEILFVGALGKMEMEKVPEAGFKIIGLPVVGLQRRLTAKNLLLPFKLYASLRAAKKIIRDFRPNIAVGVGGYASGPLLYMASKMNIPTLIQEQNSFAGITNKLLGKRVNKICVAYEGMETFFPAQKIVLTGNPVRQIFDGLSNKRAESLNHFGLKDEKKTVLVIGGSLGARSINHSVLNALPEFKGMNIQLIWQTGKSFSAEAERAVEPYDGFVATAFIKQMDLAYAASDLVVSRAGAISVSELCLAAKPAILIPSPNVAEDHQTKNAKALTEKDAAILIKDQDVLEQLPKTVKELLDAEDRLELLKTNISKMAHLDADQKIAKEIIQLMETGEKN